MRVYWFKCDQGCEFSRCRSREWHQTDEIEIQRFGDGQSLDENKSGIQRFQSCERSFQNLESIQLPHNWPHRRAHAFKWRKWRAQTAIWPAQRSKQWDFEKIQEVDKGKLCWFQEPIMLGLYSNQDREDWWKDPNPLQSSKLQRASSTCWFWWREIAVEESTSYWEIPRSWEIIRCIILQGIFHKDDGFWKWREWDESGTIHCLRW